MRVFLDMDDTLAAFKLAFTNACGMHPLDFKAKALAFYEARGFSQHDSEVLFVVDFWVVVLNTHMFWEKIPPMKDFKKMWRYFKSYNPIIVTAVPEFIELKSDAIQGKRQWINKWMNHSIRMLTIDLNSLQHEKMDKTKFCTGYDDVLIDDNKRNVEQWIKVGGRAIHFINAKDTIKQFKTMMKETHHEEKK